jgi:hypothetical protein
MFDADLADPVELIGVDMRLPPGGQRYVAVRLLTPSIRFRMMVVGPADADPELYEEERARRIFEINENQQVREVQAGLLGWGGRRSGDQFCVYVADRFVLPTLKHEDIAAIASGRHDMDAFVRRFMSRSKKDKAQ